MKISAKYAVTGFVAFLLIFAIARWVGSEISPALFLTSKSASAAKAVNPASASMPVERLQVATPVVGVKSTAVTMSPDLAGATSDPAVVAFFLKHDPSTIEIGEIKVIPSHSQQFYVDGKLVFEGSQILKRRSIASDGTIALAAIIDPSDASNKTNNNRSRRASIWIIYPNGTKKQVSPPNVDASLPLISPDSKQVAFTGVTFGQDGGEGEPKLWVCDLLTNQVRIFGSLQKYDEYSVAPVEWVEDGKLLHALEDHGETGGHMVMRIISL